MPRVRAGLACPLCDRVGVTSELYADVPGTRVSCESGNAAHVWNDALELRQLQPRSIQLPKKVEAPQAGYVRFEVRVPESTQKALETKYGEAMQATVSSLLQAAGEPEMMVLGSADLDRISQRLGKHPGSSAELFGMIFQLGEEIKTLNNDKHEMEQQTAHGKGGAKGDGITVDLGQWLMKGMIKANESNLPLEEFLSKYLQDALENDWMG